MTASLHSAQRGIILAALASTGFGLLGFFAKQLFAQGMGIGHVLMLRFWIATAILWGYLIFNARAHLRSITARQVILCILLGIIGYAGQATLYFTALRELKSGLASILLYLYPAVVALLATIITRRPPTRLQGIALFLAFIGCALVINVADASLTGLGILAGICSAVWYAGYLVGSEIILRGIKAEVASGFIFIGASLSFSFYAVLFEQPSWPVGRHGWLCVAAMAIIATVIPVVTLFMAIKKIGTVKTSIICTLEPVVTLIAGFVLLDEYLTPTQLVGIGLILATLVLLRLKEARSARFALNT